MRAPGATVAARLAARLGAAGTCMGAAATFCALSDAAARLAAATAAAGLGLQSACLDLQLQ